MEYFKPLNLWSVVLALVETSSSTHVKVFTFTKADITVGRGADCDLEPVSSPKEILPESL